MSGRPRRGAAAAAAAALKKLKEMKKEEEVKEEEEEEEEKEEEEQEDEIQIIENDEDDGPPPLERETSCGDNEDTDGETREEDSESSANGNIEPQEEGINGIQSSNLEEVLSSMFTYDQPSSNKNSNISPPIDSSSSSGSSKFLTSTFASISGSIPKSLPLKKPPLTATTFKFTSAGLSDISSSGNRKYGNPPPIPQSLRNIASNNNNVSFGVGSNTSLGPARLLENKKRNLQSISNRTSLVTYNGGRAGEKFPKIAKFATTSSTTAFDVHTMLREQSPVKMQVSVGADHDNSNGNSIQEAMELASLQKETIGNIAKKSTNHSLLLSSMVLNGLNTLQNTEDYKNFTGDLFALLTKYNIQ